MPWRGGPFFASAGAPSLPNPKSSVALAAEDVAASIAAAARRVRKRLGYLIPSPDASPPPHTFAAAVPTRATVTAAIPSPQAVAAATAPETAAAAVLPPAAAAAPLAISSPA